MILKVLCPLNKLKNSKRRTIIEIVFKTNNILTKMLPNSSLLRKLRKSKKDKHEKLPWPNIKFKTLDVSHFKMHFYLMIIDNVVCEFNWLCLIHTLIKLDFLLNDGNQLLFYFLLPIYGIEKEFFWGQIFGMEIWIDSAFWDPLNSKNHIFSDWSVCLCVCVCVCLLAA